MYRQKKSLLPRKQKVSKGEFKVSYRGNKIEELKELVRERIRKSLEETAEDLSLFLIEEVMTKEYLKVCTETKNLFTENSINFLLRILKKNLCQKKEELQILKDISTQMIHNIEDKKEIELPIYMFLHVITHQRIDKNTIEYEITNKKKEDTSELGKKYQIKINNPKNKESVEDLLARTIKREQEKERIKKYEQFIVRILKSHPKIEKRIPSLLTTEELYRINTSGTTLIEQGMDFIVKKGDKIEEILLSIPKTENIYKYVKKHPTEISKTQFKTVLSMIKKHKKIKTHLEIYKAAESLSRIVKEKRKWNKLEELFEETKDLDTNPNKFLHIPEKYKEKYKALSIIQLKKTLKKLKKHQKIFILEKISKKNPEKPQTNKKIEKIEKSLPFIGLLVATTLLAAKLSLSSVGVPIL